MIRAVLFDLDGTLIDSRQDLADAVNAALRATDLPERSTADIVQYVGNGMHALLKAVVGPVDELVFRRAIDVFRAAYAENCLTKTRLYPDVAETLDALKGKARLAVVTNKPAEFTEKILAGLQVRTVFSSVVGGDSSPHKKPHPGPVQKALTDLGVTAADALMVGDGAQDLEAGRAAGTRTCRVSFGFGWKTGAVESDADFVIDAFSKLKEIVQ